ARLRGDDESARRLERGPRLPGGLDRADEALVPGAHAVADVDPEARVLARVRHRPPFLPIGQGEGEGNPGAGIDGVPDQDALRLLERPSVEVPRVDDRR